MDLDFKALAAGLLAAGLMAFGAHAHSSKAGGDAGKTKEKAGEIAPSGPCDSVTGAQPPKCI